MNRTRRSVLFAGVSASLALAGCSSLRAGPTPSPTASPADETPRSDRLPLGDPVVVGDGQLAVTHVAVQRMVPVERTGATEILGREDEQYVVASVERDGVDEPSARSGLVLDVDGDRYDPVDPAVTPLEERWRVAFPVPTTIDPEAVAVVWTGEGGEAVWPLEAARRDELASPPAFDVRDFSVSETSDPELVPTSVDVWNRGEMESTFVATLGVEGDPDPTVHRREIGADTLSGHTTFLSLDADPGETVTVVLDWGYGRLTDSVTITEQ